MPGIAASSISAPSRAMSPTSSVSCAHEFSHSPVDEGTDGALDDRPCPLCLCITYIWDEVENVRCSDYMVSGAHCTAYAVVKKPVGHLTRRVTCPSPVVCPRTRGGVSPSEFVLHSASSRSCAVLESPGLLNRFPPHGPTGLTLRPATISGFSGHSLPVFRPVRTCRWNQAPSLDNNHRVWKFRQSQP
jgi:hypothetical protein